MRFQSHHSGSFGVSTATLVRSGVVATVQLLTMMLALQWMSASAWASCGDYLAHSGDMAAHDLMRDGPSPLHKPCDGPSCRQAPAPVVPPIPSTPDLRRVADAVLALVGDVAATGPQFACSRRLDSEHPLPGHPQTILRPPIG